MRRHELSSFNVCQRRSSLIDIRDQTIYVYHDRISGKKRTKGKAK
jgi:hypothetical protein